MIIRKSTILHSRGAPFCRMLLLCAAFVCLALVVYRMPLWLRLLHTVGVFGVTAAGITLAVVFVYAALSLSATAVKRLVLNMALLVVALLGVEYLVVTSSPAVWTDSVTAKNLLVRWRDADKLGIDFDRRTVTQVVDDLRMQGIDALPGIGRGWPRRPQVRAQLPEGLYPLSHASSAHVVECNEGGEYFVYQTDEYGFNNPPGMIESGHVDVSVIGESNVLGHCVPAGHGFVDVLRGRIPRTANFGMADTHPLTQLASLREYVEPLKSRIVVWFVNPGFAVGRSEEEADPILRRYFDPEFSQGLIDRQTEIDAAVRKLSPLTQAETDHALQLEIERAMQQRFSRVHTLYEVRNRFFSEMRSSSAPPNSDMQLFERSLRLADEAVSRWGGRLVVVTGLELSGAGGNGNQFHRYQLVRSTVERLGIDFIDLGAVSLKLSDPAALLIMYRTGNHPNANGHAFVGEHVATELLKRLDAPADSYGSEV